MDINLFNLQLMADAGTLVNTTTGTANAYTGEKTTSSDMTPTMKTYYDTELLENARSENVFSQLGKKQSLPRKHGKTVEWRKFNTFEKALTPLQEAVIPTGKKFGMTSINVAVQQFGDYTTVSDQLDMHAVDPVILGATEEMGAAAGATADTLVRNVLITGTNVMYAPNGSTPVNSRAALTAACKLTPDVVHKAVTWLKKCKAPKFDGKWYVAVIHPSVAYDLTSSAEWVEAHKYAGVTEIFNGEIGQLRGCRFIESNEAPVFSNGASSNAVMAYATLFFGKDAFGVVDPEGMGLEMIVKSREQVGGPLNQFSTVGYKFETATKILYQERMLRVESGSSYSATDTAN